MRQNQNKTTIASLIAAASVASAALAAEEHEHTHHKEYLADGAVDIALVYDADHSELEFAVFAGEAHGHGDDHGDDHGDEHGDDHGDEHGDDHGDEHGDEHGDDHGDDHGEEHGDEHEHGDGIALGDAVILGGADTKYVLPEGGGFDFLGEAGDEVYRLPQDAASGPAAPGFAMEFEDGIFSNDAGSIELTGFEGPGHLVAFILGGFGEITTVFDTRDGLDASDTFTGPGETHQHLNWVFTEPGIYHLELEGRAELATDSTVLSTAGELKFHIGSGAAYLREIDDFESDWATTENLGEVYTADFPWLYMPLLESWAFAMGEGGDSMFLFIEALDTWTFTGVEAAPWFYDFARGAWIYALSQPNGDVWIYDSSTQSWSSLP